MPSSGSKQSSDVEGDPRSPESPPQTYKRPLITADAAKERHICAGGEVSHVLETGSKISTEPWASRSPPQTRTSGQGPSLRTPLPCKWRRLWTLCASPHNPSRLRNKRQCCMQPLCSGIRATKTGPSHKGVIGEPPRKIVDGPRPRASAHGSRQRRSARCTAHPIAHASPVILKGCSLVAIAWHRALETVPDTGKSCSRPPSWTGGGAQRIP